MKSYIPLAALLLLLGFGCTPNPNSGKGFSLPEGDAQLGKETFIQLRCYDCHSVSGVEFERSEAPGEPLIALGGVTRLVKTYGDLVTSIINPSHRYAVGYTDDAVQLDGESKMRLYNDEMTVKQLTDLVTFLQTHYEVDVYPRTPYLPFH